MAKINTVSAGEVARMINPATGDIVLFRSDGKILMRSKLTGDWNLHRKVRDGGSIEAAIASRRANGWTDAPKRLPTVRKMQQWADDGVAEAVDGCRVEPDGKCQHGSPSWLVALGHI